MRADSLHEWASGIRGDSPGTPSPREQQLEAALLEILQAIDAPGLNPKHHLAIVTAHRREWPTLWSAIDRARVTLMRGRR